MYKGQPTGATPTVLSSSNQMAVVIRSACFLAGPYCVTSPPSDLVISGNLHLPGKLDSLLFKVERFATSFGDASSVPSPFRHKLAKTEGVHLRPAVQGEVIQISGLLARQRRGELERLNEQLRQINAALRRQAKIESYAPSLSYAPIGSRIAENEVIVDPRKQELISRLKTGKNFLRNQDPEKAFVEFKTALELAQSLKDSIEEKKAARGLGASLQRQGKYREAIKYHSLVLAISEREGENSGNTEAYGAIADCYTELGDLERAGKFYDKYIARLETD
ncbi:protein FLUORESCENT IN BLUE LIGHT, chloroplastic isoform X2 [Hevea brasiliensis]|uniref:protein FLUORESCENT IN BLUE LIGHT, chloroplastic isoform X2 n=1 Tax=Hevea brasiliensis TaxID=3981 RepID=UPI0025D5EAE3|nr:protein FLUORESCENT IN BLUE LIGHT, chloroplastic isoform X2 [Hevea brasiliensis]